MTTTATLPRGFAPLSDGIAPDYSGRSIANVPATVLSLLAGRVPHDILPPLAEAALPARLLRGVERVLLVVADGLGWDQTRRAIEDGRAPTLAALAARGSLAPATSVLPSTTVAALASLATGYGPRRHGLTGYRTFLPALGTTVNLIRMQPLLGGPELPRLGIAPERFFPFETLTSRLVAASVPTRVVTRGAYVRSPLSQMLYRGVEPEGYAGVGDAFARTRRALAALGGSRGFVETYWDLVDTVAHAAGPESEEHDAEVATFDAALGREIVDRVNDPGTLLLLTADHGHIAVPPDRVLSWNAHPDVLADLARPPTGEGRLAYLAVRDGARERVRERLEHAFGEAVTVMDAQDLEASGAFGPGPAHPEFSLRVGDLVVFARDDHRLQYAATPETAPKPLVGHHGGVAEREMLVPLLAARLG